MIFGIDKLYKATNEIVLSL